jgi:hypothetical protein
VKGSLDNLREKYGTYPIPSFYKNVTHIPFSGLEKNRKEKCGIWDLFREKIFLPLSPSYRCHIWLTNLKSAE